MQLKKRLLLGTALLCVMIVSNCGDDVKCPAIQILCSDFSLGTEICVTPTVDRNHCGECGNECVRHADCANGECTCVAGYTDCDGECVNLNFDANNCGVCGNACGAGRSCVNGVC
jgi:hypothetical protein